MATSDASRLDSRRPIKGHGSSRAMAVVMALTGLSALCGWHFDLTEGRRFYTTIHARGAAPEGPRFLDMK